MTADRMSVLNFDARPLTSKSGATGHYLQIRFTSVDDTQNYDAVCSEITAHAFADDTLCVYTGGV